MLRSALRQGWRQIRWFRGDREAVFTRIAENRYWNSAETVSGVGSELATTGHLRDGLPELLRELGVRSLIDAGCGDCNWIARTQLPIESYRGIEIVPSIVETLRERFADRAHMQFRQGDISRIDIPPADLILARDVLVHNDNAAVTRFLKAAVASGAAWLLTTHFPGHTENRAIVPGDWRPINLCRPPFRLPEPERQLSEEANADHPDYRDKTLALWRLAEVAKAVQ
jgi:hypothetical protein